MNNLYTALSNILQQDPFIRQNRKNGFGSGLRYHGKVFAMLAKGHLVVKLPEARIKELEEKARVRSYIHSGGRPTRGWCVVMEDTLEEWTALASEAKAQY